MFLASQFENPIQDVTELITETYPYLEATVNLSTEGKYFLHLYPVLKYLCGAQFGSL
jgi:hypothetical protein